MTDRGGGASLLPYTPAGLTGSDDDDDDDDDDDSALGTLLPICSRQMINIKNGILS